MENEFFLCWHKQLQLSTFMDFEDFIEKWTTCDKFFKFPTLKIYT